MEVHLEPKCSFDAMQRTGCLFAASAHSASLNHSVKTGHYSTLNVTDAAFQYGEKQEHSAGTKIKPVNKRRTESFPMTDSCWRMARAEYLTLETV